MIEIVGLKVPKDCNIILGMSHFIKTVEDLYEAMVNSVPNSKFGIAFCEASGPCLIRGAGTDDELCEISIENAQKVASGHFFVILVRGSYPINYLNSIKRVHEVCSIYCATANPVQVLVVETDQGRGIVGVVDGYKSKGVETGDEVVKRKKFLRDIGYKM
jgi:adenosine/AMP kinase